MATLKQRIEAALNLVAADYKAIQAQLAKGMPAARSLDGSDDSVTDITIIDDGSSTTNWPNRWTWSFGTTVALAKLVQWVNEYGELRLTPAKVNTVALRIFAKTTPTEPNHSGPVFEIQDNRNDRNSVFAVDGLGNTVARNIAQKVRTVPTGTSGFENEPDGTLWIEYTP